MFQKVDHSGSMLPADIQEFQSWGNSVTQQLMALTFKHKGKTESLFKENRIKFVADFRKLALKYHPDRIINDPERKTLYNGYFQALSNIRDQIEQDWERVLKDVMDEDLQAIHNEFVELGKSFEKLWQELREISNLYKEIAQLQDKMAEQNQQMREELENVESLGQSLAQAYRTDCERLDELEKGQKEASKLLQEKNIISQSIEKAKQELIKHNEHVNQIFSRLIQLAESEPEVQKEITQTYEGLREIVKSLYMLFEKTDNLLEEASKSNDDFFKSLGREKRLEALNFDEKLQQTTAEWFGFLDEITAKIKKTEVNYDEISQQHKEIYIQFNILFNEQTNAKNQLAELEERLFAVEHHIHTKNGTREVRRTLDEMIALGEVVVWEPELDTSAKVDILKDILNYLEKIASEMKAFFDVKETTLFKFWQRIPDNNVISSPEDRSEPTEGLTP